MQRKELTPASRESHQESHWEKGSLCRKSGKSTQFAGFCVVSVSACGLSVGVHQPWIGCRHSICCRCQFCPREEWPVFAPWAVRTGARGSTLGIETLQFHSSQSNDPSVSVHLPVMLHSPTLHHHVTVTHILSAHKPYTASQYSLTETHILSPSLPHTHTLSLRVCLHTITMAIYWAPPPPKQRYGRLVRCLEKGPSKDPLSPSSRISRMEHARGAGVFICKKKQEVGNILLFFFY